MTPHFRFKEFSSTKPHQISDQRQLVLSQIFSAQKANELPMRRGKVTVIVLHVMYFFAITICVRRLVHYYNMYLCFLTKIFKKLYILVTYRSLLLFC